MAITTDTLNRKLYDNLSSYGYNPKPINAKTGKVVVPEEADIIQFDFDKGEGTDTVTLAIEMKNDKFNLVVYYDEGISKKDKDGWYKLLPQLRRVSQQSGIQGFELKNLDRLSPDLQKREFNRKKETLGESYIPLNFHSIELSTDKIADYARDYFESYGIEASHQKFISNVKLFNSIKLIESKENNEIQGFVKALDRLDTKKEIKIGDKFAVLAFEIRFAWREIDILGFTEPKEVADIKLHSDGTINYIKFTDGDRYPRLVKATHNNKPIVQSAYFDNKNNAEKALTYLKMIIPENWEVDMSNLKTNKDLDESDISGLLAASRLNRSFIITAQTAEGQTKKYRVKAQSPNVAKEKFMKHHSMAKIVDVKEEGVAEGYSLKKTNVEKYMKPGDPDEYTQDINIKDTDYEIINNKTGQVVGTASWTTNDYFGPGALKITMKNGATRYLDIWEREKGNPQTAFNRFVKDPKTAKKYKEEGVAEGLENSGVQEAIVDTVERLFRKNEISDYGALEAIRQGVKHHFSKPGATAESAIEGILNILDKRMSKSGNYVDLGRFKEALRQGVAHQMKKQGVAEGKKQVSEGYYPMGKQGSYSDAIPTTKIILQHTRKIEEGEQRYRNIAKIFVENMNGERFLVPTTKPGIARVYARHIAEGGTPYDERGKHITSLVEEYQKMAGFVRATRNKQFNESAQKLVNEGVSHYQSLRETLHKMCGHRGYNAYFESYTPTLVEDGEEQSNLNELFVQETLDPRIESVMPILSRLHKKVSEMKEVGELAEWADSLEEAEEIQEENTPLRDKEDLMARRKALQDILLDPDTAKDPLLKREAMKRKHDLENEARYEGLVEEMVDEDASVPLDVRKLYAQTYAKIAKTAVAAKGAKQMAYAMVEKKYGKDMAEKLKAYHNQNQNMEEDLDANQKRAGQLGPTEKVGPKGAVGKLVGGESAEPKDEMVEDIDQIIKLSGIKKGI